VLVCWDARGVLRTRFKPRGASAFAPPTRSAPARLLRRHAPGRHAERPAPCWPGAPSSSPRAAVRGPSASRPPCGPRRPPLRARPAARDDPRAPPTTGSAARSTRSPTRRASSRSRGAGAAGVRVQRGGAPAQTVSAPGTTAVLSDLAAGPDGRLAVVWDGGVESSASLVRACTRGRGRRALRRAPRTSRPPAATRAPAAPRSSAPSPSWCSRAGPPGAASRRRRAYVR
jgi:hypothetical protein